MKFAADGDTEMQPVKKTLPRRENAKRVVLAPNVGLVPRDVVEDNNGEGNREENCSRPARPSCSFMPPVKYDWRILPIVSAAQLLVVGSPFACQILVWRLPTNASTSAREFAPAKTAK
jgi:hypothetical protein